jgi:hypothetical protein
VSQNPVRIESVNTLPAVQAERLAVLDMAAEEYVRTQRPANTQRAYAADWKVWTRYVAELGIPEHSATAGALVGFVVWLERQDAAPTTIDRRLTGAVIGLRQRGAEPPKSATGAARAALGGYRRRLAEAGEKRGQGQAAAMSVRDVRAMCAACPDTLAGIRDRAVVLLAFSIAGRRSEAASLLVSDVVEAPEGLVVTVRTGKTGGRTVAVPYGSHEGTCPVRAWRAWLAESGSTDGPAFRRIDRHGRVLDVPRALAQYLGRLLNAERRERGTRRNSRASTCCRQAVFGLRWFREDRDVSAPARDCGISRATGHRYPDEVVEVLAAQAPDLHEASQRAEDDGPTHLVLDGKLFSTDRLGEQTTSVKGERIDARYSGKHREQGGNVQALMEPNGFPLWFSEVEPGSTHDITAAREHVLGALYRAYSRLDLPTPADGGYGGAGIGVHTPIGQPAGNQTPDADNRTYNALLRGLRCPGRTRLRAPPRPPAGTPPHHHQPAQDRHHRQSRTRPHPFRTRPTGLKVGEITSVNRPPAKGIWNLLRRRFSRSTGSRTATP